MKQPIYLDYQATTPLAPEVFNAMVPWLRDNFGNPHSAHIMGRQAAAAVEAARDQVAAMMPSGGKVIFTGSATEAINLAFGAAWKPAKANGRERVCGLATEHAAVLDTLAYLEDACCSDRYDIPVGDDGLVELEKIESCLSNNDCSLLAAMLVNNEIGVRQPIEKISQISKKLGCYLLCDAVQGFGRIKIPNVVDMVAISGHKIHGPKGIGALWVRDGIELRPVIHGGGQEAGIRSGTLSPALCVGLGAAAKIASDQMEQDHYHVEELAKVAKRIFADWTINGSTDHRYAGNLNIRREGLDVSRLMSDVRSVAFSAGSACASGSGRPSHVLKALGLDDRQIKSSIRLGFGRYTTEDEIIEAARLINAAAEAQLA